MKDHGNIYETTLSEVAERRIFGRYGTAEKSA